jgi:hypothetical protein
VYYDVPIICRDMLAPPGLLGQGWRSPLAPFVRGGRHQSDADGDRATGWRRSPCAALASAWLGGTDEAEAGTCAVVDGGGADPGGGALAHVRGALQPSNPQLHWTTLGPIWLSVG